MQLHAPLIVGGGPAGSAAAIRLARGGCQPTLIERQPGPIDKVCGDFLSAEAITILASLGVDLGALDPAPIRALRLIHRAGVAETRLPFPAMAVSRRVLDEALLHRAAAEGAIIHRGHAVRRVEVDGLRVDAGALGAFEPATVFLATGKHDLRGLARPGRAGGPIGLKTYFALSPAQCAALAGHVELVLFPGGYAGLQPVEGGRATLCLIVSAARWEQVGQRWDALLDALTTRSAHLAARLAGARPLLERPLAVAGLPYGYLHPPTAPLGLYRLGDQASVIPSLTGDGVSIALASGALAAETWLAAGDARLYHQRLFDRLHGQMRLATLIHRAALGAGQPLLLAAGRAAPALMRLAASRTRLREELVPVVTG
jgi:flavin-dependent dehydrogenase